MSEVVSKYVRSIEVAPTPPRENVPLPQSVESQKISVLARSLILGTFLFGLYASLVWARNAYQSEQDLAVIAYATMHECQSAQVRITDAAPKYVCNENGTPATRSLKDIQEISMGRK